MKLRTVLVGAALSAGIAAYLMLRQAGTDAPRAPGLSMRPDLPPALPTQALPAGATLAGLDEHASAQQLNHRLENASDLRQLYEQYKDSKNALEKNAAYRAWSACFPAFIAPKGQASDPEKMRAGLPSDVSEQRLDAYRGLFGRCKNFSDMTREQIVAATEAQKYAQARGLALAPGQLAARYFIDGDFKRASATAHQAIASQDPYAIDSLKDYVYQVWATRMDDGPEYGKERPDLRSLAFSLAACQLGLECGAGSLTALLQCANTGGCEGGVSERYLQSLPSEADRAALRLETRRTLEAIRNKDYAALGLQN